MSEAIEKDPSNPVLYYNLGVVSADLGEDDADIEYYKKSIELTCALSSVKGLST